MSAYDLNVQQQKSLIKNNYNALLKKRLSLRLRRHFYFAAPIVPPKI